MVPVMVAVVSPAMPITLPMPPTFFTPPAHNTPTKEKRS
jgi:hypothetical protein